MRQKHLKDHLKSGATKFRRLMFLTMMVLCASSVMVGCVIARDQLPNLK